MPTYRVTYFNSRGRAEVMRQMLTYAGQEFEDRRLEGEAWQKLKPETPFGQMPLLEVDGKMVCQSNAAARYIAKTFGLYGSTTWESAEVDMVIDCMEDTIKPVMAFFFCKDEAKKEELKKKYEEEQLPLSLGHLEKLISANGSGEYFVGNKLSWADIQVANFMNFPSIAGVTVDYAKFPKIKALVDRVNNEPKIKEWIAKRPETKM